MSRVWYTYFIWPTAVGKWIGMDSSDWNVLFVETPVHGNGVCGRWRCGNSAEECGMPLAGDGTQVLCWNCTCSGVHPQPRYHPQRPQAWQVSKLCAVYFMCTLRMYAQHPYLFMSLFALRIDVISMYTFWLETHWGGLIMVNAVVYSSREVVWLSKGFTIRTKAELKCSLCIGMMSPKRLYSPLKASSVGWEDIFTTLIVVIRRFMHFKSVFLLRKVSML